MHAVYEHNALDRELVELDGGSGPGGRDASSRSRSTSDHNEATVALDRIGADVVAVLGGALAEQADRGRDVVHVELRARRSRDRGAPGWPSTTSSACSSAGSCPSCASGDVLRLQWLNGVEADPSDVAVASDFGEELLAYVFEREAHRPSTV